MASQRQKYRPVMNAPPGINPTGTGRRHEGFKPQRLKQSSHAGQETERMPGAHIPVVNPVSAGDRSTAMNSCRTYQKGKKNRTIS